MLMFYYAEWEMVSIYLNFLSRQLPTAVEDSLSEGILDSIDVDSYRVEKQATQRLLLPDEDAEIGPVPVSGVGGKPEPEIDRLSNIVKTFNDQFGTLFSDADRVTKRITEDIAPKVAADAAYQNARENTPGTARMELVEALKRVVTPLFRDDTEFYKQFTQNEPFRRSVTDFVESMTR